MLILPQVAVIFTLDAGMPRHIKTQMKDALFPVDKNLLLI
jgi:hypothetical protein